MKAKRVASTKVAQIVMGAFLYGSQPRNTDHGAARATQLNIGVLRGQGALVNKFDGRSKRRRMERLARKMGGEK